MLTAIRQAGQGLVKAFLVIEEPQVDEPVIELQLNPTQYQLQKTNNFAEIAIPGLESPPIQFVRGAAETLSAELLVDTSDTLENVRTRHVSRLRGLMKLEPELHAPPILRLEWDDELFRGVLESLDVTYTLFTPEGVPLRARLAVKLKEYRPVEVQVRESPTLSPDFEKTWVVRRGDTLSSVAAGAYRDPARWREIARANAITDPRRLAPGRVLTLPKLR